MENGGGEASAAAWQFGAANPALEAARSQSIRALVYRVYACLDRGDARPVAPLGHGDPAAFACFRAAPAATGAVVAAAASGAHDSYAPPAGIAEACSAGAGAGETAEWRFGAANPALAAAGSQSIRAIVTRIYHCLDGSDARPVAPLAHGDPSAFPCFRTAPAATDAIAAAATSGKYNHYSPAVGIAPACSAVAAHLSRELPYSVSPADVVLTAGCNHAVEIMMSVLASPGANVLLPRPGYPLYASRAALSGLEFRYFDLLPDREWEIDLAGVEALADANTVAMVIVNPNNPCGCVYSRDHLAKIAEMARKLGIMVISDEVYDHFAFGSKPFVPMGVFGDVAPVMTLGGISKRWMVPGWRLGWIAATDPNGILRRKKIIDSIVDYRAISVDPVTFVQGALPDILAKTDEAFFANALGVVKEAAEICYEKLKEIDCITCPHKPEGSMFVMAKLDLSSLDGIEDDVDFCSKLAKEESVVICPGSGLGMKNWLRITFAVDPQLLEDGLERTKCFCKRHGKIKEAGS